LVWNSTNDNKRQHKSRQRKPNWFVLTSSSSNERKLPASLPTMELPSSPSVNLHLVPSPESVYSIGTRLNIESNSILGGACRAEIIEHKRVKWDRTSQVVVLQVIDTNSETLSKGTRLIGKIFDPVYDISVDSRGCGCKN
jgi:hypothetical protein